MSGVACGEKGAAGFRRGGRASAGSGGWTGYWTITYSAYRHAIVVSEATTLYTTSHVLYCTVPLTRVPSTRPR